jgi:hypothetical protein
MGQGLQVGFWRKGKDEKQFGTSEKDKEKLKRI